MSHQRHRFAGVANIVRFNWGKYVAAVVAVVGFSAVAAANPSMRVPVVVVIAAVSVGVMVSIAVSYWVYDASGLYDFEWSDTMGDNDRVAVVHAGFDEVSATLRTRHAAPLYTASFYDRIEVAEASIRRARDHSPASRSAVATAGGPLLAAGGFDWVIAFMCLHELRTAQARQEVISELADGLAAGGKIVVVEHLRDTPNTIAFSIGVFHFLSKSSWVNDFTAAGLAVVSERKVTPFVSVFVLRRTDQT